MLNYLSWPAIYCLSHLCWNQVLVRDPGLRRLGYLVLLGWEGVGTFVHLSSLHSFVLFLADYKYPRVPSRPGHFTLECLSDEDKNYILSSIPSVAQGREQGAAFAWPSSIDPHPPSVLDLNVSQNILTDCTFMGLTSLRSLFWESWHALPLSSVLPLELMADI